jgi:hypothetical protein
MNALLSCKLAEQDPVAFEYLAKSPVRLPKIRHPASTVTVLEETETTIDDGSTSLVGFNGPTLA